MKRIVLTLLLSCWAMGQNTTNNRPIVTVEIINLLHWATLRDVRDKHCIEYYNEAVICSGTYDGIFDVWEEPIVLPTSAVVSLAPSNVEEIPAMMVKEKQDAGFNWCNSCSGNICTDMACGPRQGGFEVPNCAKDSNH